MKTNFFSFNILTLLVCLCVFFSACTKDDGENAAVNDRLDGNWTVTSWMVDEEEQMGGPLATSYTIEFNKTTADGGDSHWQIISQTGFVTNLEGDYKVTQRGEVLEFRSSEWNISFDGDDLRVSGNVAQGSYVLIAEKQ